MFAFLQNDNTFNEIRKKSLNQWLDEMESHPDISVRCGIPLVRQYIEHQEMEITNLEKSNELKEKYLTSMKTKIKAQ